MKVCNKILGIAYQLNVEDSVHSFFKNLHSKQLEEQIREGKGIHFSKAERQAVLKLSATMQSWKQPRVVPRTSEDAQGILTLLQR